MLIGVRRRQLRDAELRRHSDAVTERRHGENVRAAGGPTWLHWVQVIAIVAGVLALVVGLIGLMAIPAR
jgi:hypothetical protein